MRNKTKSAMITAGLLLFAGVSEARTVRAIDMDSSLWSNLSAGTPSDIIVEFRRDDEVPIHLTAEGDLIESTQAATSYVRIKRNFWLKVQQQKIKISLDGMTFKDLSDVLTGSIKADTGPDPNGGIANVINLAFRAFLR